MQEEEIRDFLGRKLGTIYIKPNGDKEARNFIGQLLGRYYKDRNVTEDFYGRVVARGDAVVVFIYKDYKNVKIFDI